MKVNPLKLIPIYEDRLKQLEGHLEVEKKHKEKIDQQYDYYQHRIRHLNMYYCDEQFLKSASETNNLRIEINQLIDSILKDIDEVNYKLSFQRKRMHIINKVRKSFRCYRQWETIAHKYIIESQQIYKAARFREVNLINNAFYTWISNTPKVKDTTTEDDLEGLD